MKDGNFPLYRAHPDEVIWSKLKIGDKYINKQVWLFIHQTMFVSRLGSKNCYDVMKFTPPQDGCLMTFKNML